MLRPSCDSIQAHCRTPWPCFQAKILFLGCGAISTVWLEDVYRASLGEDLAACSDGAVTGSARCGDASVCYLPDAAGASIRAASASAAVHLACFQRPGQYPLSDCVKFRSQDLLVCIPAMERTHSFVHTGGLLPRGYVDPDNKPCTGQQSSREKMQAAGSTSSNGGNACDCFVQRRQSLLLYMNTTNINQGQASTSVKRALPGRTRVVHSPSYPTRACPAINNQCTSNS